jgi:hypothetical protein
VKYSREFEDWYRKTPLSSAIPFVTEVEKKAAWKGWQEGYRAGYRQAQNSILDDTYKGDI